VASCSGTPPLLARRGSPGIEPATFLSPDNRSYLLSYCRPYTTLHYKCEITELCVVPGVFQKQTLMQHVLRCDYESCRQYLVNLEQAFLLEQSGQALDSLLGHRCDGNRNILHASVSVCFPVSNKETKEEEGEREGLLEGAPIIYPARGGVSGSRHYKPVSESLSECPR